jgi:hypothetical protein
MYSIVQEESRGMRDVADVGNVGKNISGLAQRERRLPGIPESIACVGAGKT